MSDYKFGLLTDQMLHNYIYYKTSHKSSHTNKTLKSMTTSLFTTSYNHSTEQAKTNQPLLTLHPELPLTLTKTLLS